MKCIVISAIIENCTWRYRGFLKSWLNLIDILSAENLIQETKKVLGRNIFLKKPSSDGRTSVRRKTRFNSNKTLIIVWMSIFVNLIWTSLNSNIRQFKLLLFSLVTWRLELSKVHCIWTFMALTEILERFWIPRIGKFILERVKFKFKNKPILIPS